MSETKPVRSNFDEAIISAYSILSLLEHRGIVDSQWNREDVAKAAEKLSPYAKVAGRMPLTANPATVEITKSPRGFNIYGNPVSTDYGDEVEVYESSAAEAPHCWLRINGEKSSITSHQDVDATAHLTIEQAVAIRDRLTAWIDEVPTRWAG